MLREELPLCRKKRKDILPRRGYPFTCFSYFSPLLVLSPQVFGRLYFLKKQPGHAEFISASHQDGYPIYRQFIAKHVFYIASEMPICIGMTPHFISSEHLWCCHQQAAMHSKLYFIQPS
jgi:hypothetical protein